jgi:hypothetical protein
MYSFGCPGKAPLQAKSVCLSARPHRFLTGFLYWPVYDYSDGLDAWLAVCLSVQPHGLSKVTAIGLVLDCFGNGKPGKAKGRQFSSSAPLRTGFLYWPIQGYSDVLIVWLSRQ